MAIVQNYYCWVKFTKRHVASGVQTAGAASQALGALDGGIPPHLLDGGIPPYLMDGGIPPHVLNGGIPPGAQLGGYFASGWWAIDEQYSGLPSSEFVVAFSAGGSRDEAVKWLGKNPQWLDGVDNYFLMSFTCASHSVIA